MRYDVYMTLPNSFREPELIPLVGPINNRIAWRAKAWQGMIGYLAGLDQQELSVALQILISSRERTNMVKRAAVVDWLAAGMSYRQMNSELGVALQTIRSIKRALKDKKYQSYSERSKTERKKGFPRVDIATSRQDSMRRERKTKYGTFRTRF